MPIGQGERWEYDAVERRDNPEAASYERNAGPTTPTIQNTYIDNSTTNLLNGGKVYFTYTQPPVRPDDATPGFVNGVALNEGDYWYGMRIITNAAGQQAALKYEVKIWMAASWLPLPVTSLILAEEILTGQIIANHIQGHTLRTFNYQERCPYDDAYLDFATGTGICPVHGPQTNGWATAGAKMEAQGTALKVASGNFKLGQRMMSEYPAVRVRGSIQFAWNYAVDDTYPTAMTATRVVVGGANRPPFGLYVSFGGPVMPWAALAQTHLDLHTLGTTFAGQHEYGVKLVARDLRPYVGGLWLYGITVGCHSAAGWLDPASWLNSGMEISFTIHSTLG